MLIGIDDTDSLKGGCTTYVGAIILKKLKGNGFPRLIRLNPNIPYKTRGNGAIALDVTEEAKTKELVLSIVKKYSQLREANTNPGVAFLRNPRTKHNKTLKDFYRKALSDLVTIEDAERAAEKSKVEIHKFKNGRGIIGAVAAIGSVLPDKTYELIAYREENKFGTPRRMRAGDIFEMDKQTYPQTFDNVDKEKNKVLIMPRGYDPILCGIRGENPKILNTAWKMLLPEEKITFKQIFETNQGTDCHLRRKKIVDIKPYDNIIVEGIVMSKPKTIEGGHVIFEFSDNSGKIMCAAYEPTGNFRKIIRKLIPNDKIRVYGGIGKYTATINIEKLKILKLEKSGTKKPDCCKKTMTSAGRNKGFKCRVCGKRLKRQLKVKLSRWLVTGFYEVTPSARRHLSKPIIRK